VVWKILLIASFVSCKHPKPPSWNGKIYAAYSQESAIVRAQSNETIYCNSAEFDNYLCISYDDYKSFIKTFVDGCQAWDRDVVEYKRKLKACGLLTDRNIKKVKECLNEEDPNI